jgi:hypothetical protein
MSAYLVVVLSVLASATATLTLNLLARLERRRARAWTRPAAQDAPAEPAELLEARQGACGCLTVTGAIALLHEQGYLPFGQLGGGELLANGRPRRRCGRPHPTGSPPSSSAPSASAPPTSSRPATWTPPRSWPPAAPTATGSPASRPLTRLPSPRCSSSSTH